MCSTVEFTRHVAFMVADHLFSQVLLPCGISISHHYHYSNHAIRPPNSGFIANTLQPPSALHLYVQLHALSKLVSTDMDTVTEGHD